ncbi:triple tyrosine motif-containing protein [Priestia aryabhattai]|uniref:triple tyrosine motif-containing protein n=1 Tax=Priestia aryabhattai TaxID=412384 RepID=UPI003D266CC4
MAIQTLESITINLLKVDKLSPVIINTNVRWEVDATGNNLEYAWYIYKGEDRVAFVPFNKSNILDWKPSEPGRYLIKVFVKDENGNKVSDWTSEYKIVGNLDSKDIKRVVPNKPSPQQWGTTIRWEAEVNGEELEYAWYIYKDEKRIDYIPYSTSNILTWTPIEVGTYQIKLFVKDTFGNKISKWLTKFLIK